MYPVGQCASPVCGCVFFFVVVVVYESDVYLLI